MILKFMKTIYSGKISFGKKQKSKSKLELLKMLSVLNITINNNNIFI